MFCFSRFAMTLVGTCERWSQCDWFVSRA